MKTIQFIYENYRIDFLTPGNENVMVNATQMAKIFDKRVDVFLKADHVKNFISALELTPFGGSSTPLKRENIIKTVSGSCTWMHRVLALKFAAWMDPVFEIWVYTTIDKVLLGYYQEHREATIEQLKTKIDIKKKREELLLKYPEFEEFIALENKLTDTEKRRLKAMRDSMKQLKLSFD